MPAAAISQAPPPTQLLKRTLPFAIVHLMPFAVFLNDSPITAAMWITCFALYFARMFFITGGYHRYFAHRTYKMNRFWQFLMAVGCCTSTQQGVLWWAAHHRIHHRHSDQPEDVHSPKHGFWWSHMGWIFAHERNQELPSQIKDFSKYPELRWLEKFEKVPAILLGAACYFIGGANMLFIGFFLSTVFLYHGTFLVNSLAHVVGTRRYETTDTSRNCWWIAILTLGEGWHNNHHHYSASTRQGFFWWEVDITYYILRAMQAVGIVSDIKEVPEKVKLGKTGFNRKVETVTAPAGAAIEAGTPATATAQPDAEIGAEASKVSA